jgi:hypothetical protein
MRDRRDGEQRRRLSFCLGIAGAAERTVKVQFVFFVLPYVWFFL